MKSSRSGTVHWEPNALAQLTRTFAHATQSAPFTAAASICVADQFAKWQHPYCDELPQAIFNIVTVDPTAEVAENYRRYVRTALVPAAQEVAHLLKAHAVVIEWPPKEWLAKQFPDLHRLSGGVATSSMFGQQWSAYALSWSRVLAAWGEAENFTVLRPAMPMPFGGLGRAMDWSRKRGEVKQQELIGMTAEVPEDDVDNYGMHCFVH